ncbi:MAG: hypothetical protein L6Q54_04560 [Leptospiraceae bacterium]|nr:hypothetical protein [Leptospiraceae bacterium]MCK6380507.1 hypothetical protein [Leptospiraceae bacterium]NUM42028.1 hypothetical protein [Leptospiraceae bacterium]
MRYFQILFFSILLFQESHSQTNIAGKQYKDLLWGKEEEFDTSDFPNGSYSRVPEDFILTYGKLWKESPPKSRAYFLYKNEKIENSGGFNNKAVSFALDQDIVKRKEAVNMLEAGVKFDPHFFPFRYNLGRLYQIDHRYDKAKREFEFASYEVPEFYKIYIHLGRLLELTNEPDEAVAMYKKAVPLNKFNTEALILLAEHFLNSELRNRALLYLRAALKIDEENPNAKMGLARLEMNSKKYMNAYKIFKRTELFDSEGKRKDYDKKFHFYFAETASFVGDYITAESQYTELLKYPNDPFFGSFSYKVVERRKEIASKFATIKKSEIE